MLWEFSKSPIPPSPPTHLVLNWISSWMKQSKINEKYTPVLHFISSFKGTSNKSFKMQLSFLLFCVALHQLFFAPADMIFYKSFRTSFSIIWKKYFVTNFFVLCYHIHSNPQWYTNNQWHTCTIFIISEMSQNKLRSFFALNCRG